jgi:hypothetical protein
MVMNLWQTKKLPIINLYKFLINKRGTNTMMNTKLNSFATWKHIILEWGAKDQHERKPKWRVCYLSMQWWCWWHKHNKHNRWILFVNLVHLHGWYTTKVICTRLFKCMGKWLNYQGVSVIKNTFTMGNVSAKKLGVEM